MAKNAPDAASLLRSRGLRSTPQRRAILGVFKGGDLEHLSAEEVHARASRTMPDLGRGTVYAALAEFTEIGLLGAVGAPEPVRYEINVERHDHFRCRLCLRLFDVDLGFGEPRGSDGFQIERLELRAEGICAQCGDYGGGLEQGARTIRADSTATAGLAGRGVAARALDTALGTIFVAASPTGIIWIAFEEDAQADRLGELASSRRGSAAARSHLDQTVAGLERYLGGDATEVGGVIDWSSVSVISTGALEAAADIPYGGRRSYSDLGIEVEPRVLGEALGANPIAIAMPCHRVLRGVEVPTSFVGGDERRRWLLAHEQRNS
jgi:O-6-methylguanine DNA methyltransferase